VQTSTSPPPDNTSQQTDTTAFRTGGSATRTSLSTMFLLVYSFMVHRNSILDDMIRSGATSPLPCLLKFSSGEPHGTHMSGPVRRYTVYSTRQEGRTWLSLWWDVAGLRSSGVYSTRQEGRTWLGLWWDVAGLRSSGGCSLYMRLSADPCKWHVAIRCCLLRRYWERVPSVIVTRKRHKTFFS
jgi:hypothetical protein